MPGEKRIGSRAGLGLVCAFALALATTNPALAGSTTYTYDEFGRVKSVAVAGQASIIYSYDAAGNRTQQAVTTGTNQPPIAVSDALSTAVSTPATFDPRANDSDPNNDTPLTITAVTNGAHGSASFTSTSVTFTPTTGYSGTDNFTYTISDGHGGTAVGTIFVTVSSNVAPIATDDAITAFNNAGYTFDPRTNDTDADGDTLTITAKTDGAHGTVAILSGGTQLSYTAASGYTGPDSFTYTISDGHGHTDVATVTANVKELVRSSAGVLTSNYTQSTGTLGYPLPPGTTYVAVIYTPTSSLACFSEPSATYCSNWISGYTQTGNGYEVTKP